MLQGKFVSGPQIQQQTHTTSTGNAHDIGREVEQRQISVNSCVTKKPDRGGLMDILSTLFHLQSRNIGMIVPSVVVSEKHTDKLEITEHPVETGAAISDHAYKSPSEVIMDVGFLVAGRYWISRMNWQVLLCLV
jgi:hypothetical protein